MCKLSGKMSINPSNRVHVRMWMPEDGLLRLSAVTDSTWITYMNKGKKIKPLILTSHPTQEKEWSAPCRSVCPSLPAFVTVWLAPQQVKHGERKKHECLLELFRVNINNIYLRIKINIRTHHLKSWPPCIIPAIIIILSTVFSDESIKPSGHLLTGWSSSRLILQKLP